MTEDFEIEKIYRVYDNSAGACLEIGPDPDGLGIEIHTPDKNSKEYYGEIRFSVCPQQARKLAEALINAADDQYLATWRVKFSI